MSEPNTIKINEIEYVRKDTLNQTANTYNGMPYVIVRTYSAGVFSGYLESRDGQEGIMRQARRLWYWMGRRRYHNLQLMAYLNRKTVNSPVPLIKLY